MARINFEESIYKDHRFIKLAIKFGDVDKALGVLVRTWCLAQKWYLKSPHRTIPFEEWERSEISELVIEVNLARRTETGIYVCGSKKEFLWLIQRQEAGKLNRKIGSRNHSGKNVTGPVGTIDPTSSFLSSLSSSLLTHNSFKECSELGNPTPSQSRLRELRGCIPELLDQALEAHLKGVNQESQRLWIKTYSDVAWIKLQLLKAITWMADNPRRAPKSRFGAFFSSWLSRSWDWHRKTISENKGVDMQELGKRIGAV